MKIFAFARRHGGITLLLGFFALLWSGHVYAHGMLGWDESHYATLGRALVEGRGYTNVANQPEKLRPPLLPASIAFTIAVTNDDAERVIKRPILMAALLGVLWVYVVVYREYGRVPAVLTAATLGAFPEYQRASSFLLTEIPFMLFYAVAITEFHRGLHRDPRAFWFAWAAVVAAVLTRYTASLFAITAPLLVILALLLDKRRVLANIRTRHFFAAPVICGAVYGLWLLRSYRLFEDPLIGFRIASLQIPAYSKHAIMSPFFYFESMPAFVGGMAMIALVASTSWVVIRRNPLGLSCLLATAVIYAWMSRYGWKEPRLVSGVLPMLAILIGIGGGELLRIATSKGASARRLALTGLFIVALAGLIQGTQAAKAGIYGSQTLGYPSFPKAMEWLEHASEPDDIVRAPNCFQVAWYAQRLCRGIPSEKKLLKEGSSFEDILDEADWIVVTSFERGQRPYLIPQLSLLTSLDFEQGYAAHVDAGSNWTVVVKADLLAERRRQSPDARPIPGRDVPPE